MAQISALETIERRLLQDQFMSMMASVLKVFVSLVQTTQRFVLFREK